MWITKVAIKEEKEISGGLYDEVKYLEVSLMPGFVETFTMAGYCSQCCLSYDADFC